MTYEGYGPGGVAVLVDTLTDNRNRTVGEIRHTFSKHGGNLGEANSVAWMFDKKGHLVISKEKASEDTLMATVLEAVKALGIEPDTAEIAMMPQNYVKLEGRSAQQMLKLMEALEDNDDTRNVWSNFDVEEKEIEASLA